MNTVVPVQVPMGMMNTTFGTFKGFPSIDYHKINFDANCVSLEKLAGPTSMVEIEEFKHLASFDYSLHILGNMGIRLKRVKITLNGGSFVTRPGVLHYMHGNVKMDAKFQVIKDPRPVYSGHGVVYFEPTFSHYILVPVNGTLFVDSSIWVAVDSGLKVERTLIPGSAALLGGEGVWQHRIDGSGWAVLSSPIPVSEIQKFIINNTKLKVDGPFAILRTGGVNFTIESAGKGMFQKLANTSGEGLLNVFSGVGEVWVVATQGQYPLLPPPPENGHGGGDAGSEIAGEVAGEVAGALLGALLS